jgi:ribosome maturation factor RimP
VKRDEKLETEVVGLLEGRMPDVEVVLAERPSSGLVRVYIDRPGTGVDLDLCERVSRVLSPLRDRYALEVSSPGLERPLTKPAHFQRVIGRRVAVRTVEPMAGRRRFTGELRGADETEIELEQDGERVRIAYDAIRSSNLTLEPAGGRR